METITSTLYRRLKKLEIRYQPGKEPVTHVIQFVDADGTIDSTLVVTHGGPAHQKAWQFTSSKSVHDSR